MLILTIRTDQPEAELSLYQEDQQLASLAWQAHRQLAETIHQKIKELLESGDKDMQAIDGIVIYKGPGSFTGLRIGFSVANALADVLKKPIMAVGDEIWKEEGITRLHAGQNDTIAQPDYGSEPKTTQQKK